MPTGDQIANDALTYAGHSYLYGGYAANPDGWDCSSFVNWVLGHDFGIALPTGIKNYDGTNHGPTTLSYLVWKGASRVGRKSVQAGDLCVWQTHMGIAINNQQMISAEDPANGTQIGNISSAIIGEVPTFMRVKGVAAGANPLQGGSPNTGAFTVSNVTVAAGRLNTWEKIGLVLFAVAAILIGLHKLGQSNAT